jgi:hypothetical protein
MATVALVMVATMAPSALPALGVVVVPPHEHFLTPAKGEEIAVGPQVCTNPQTLTGLAFYEVRQESSNIFLLVYRQSVDLP